MANKIFGYLFVLLGLVIIFAALYGSYEIFTGKMAAPLIFSMQEKKSPDSATKSQDIQKQMEELVQKQITDLIPIDFLPKILNLFSWSILAGILIFGGGQVAGIGIRLISVK